MSTLRSSLGFSLLEMMISASLGILVLISAGSVLVSTQKLNTERSLRQYLLQSGWEVMQFISQDLRRAGGSDDDYLLDKLEDNLRIEAELLQYRYRRQGEIYHTQLLADRSTQKLLFCLQKQRVGDALVDANCRYFSLLDDKRLKLMAFRITPFAENSAQAGLIRLEMTLALKHRDDSYQQNFSTYVYLRNKE